MQDWAAASPIVGLSANACVMDFSRVRGTRPADALVFVSVPDDRAEKSGGVVGGGGNEGAIKIQRAAARAHAKFMSRDGSEGMQ